jgi:hypothetical protein
MNKSAVKVNTMWLTVMGRNDVAKHVDSWIAQQLQHLAAPPPVFLRRVRNGAKL